MQRYFIELAYKGTAYSGFQVQENANTIQQEVSKALETLFRQSFILSGSSRTDSGVHAYQNYFHFDSEIEIPYSSVYNLNALLPPDITIKGVFAVPPAAHCRFDAVAREYRYFVYGKKDPFMADRGWLYSYPVNMDLLQAAARVIMEYSDFTSFAKRNSQVKTYMCKIVQSEWVITGNTYVYHVRANRFLRGMVRGLVATMLKVGRGHMGLDELREAILARDNTKVDFSAPPQGLFLVGVKYDGELAGLLAGVLKGRNPVKNASFQPDPHIFFSL